MLLPSYSVAAPSYSPAPPSYPSASATRRPLKAIRQRPVTCRPPATPSPISDLPYPPMVGYWQRLRPDGSAANYHWWFLRCAAHQLRTGTVAAASPARSDTLARPLPKRQHGVDDVMMLALVTACWVSDEPAYEPDPLPLPFSPEPDPIIEPDPDYRTRSVAADSD
ncbi:MAG: hypothetical protein R2857_01200 [Vampirovibrionales bacterium]